jgi:hypothetical protein
MDTEVFMSAAKQVLNRMINELPEEAVPDVMRYIIFIQKEKKNLIFNELEQASNSSMDFWNNEIDDEVWNNV